jgi:hypothetical protein
MRIVTNFRAPIDGVLFGDEHIVFVPGDRQRRGHLRSQFHLVEQLPKQTSLVSGV